METYSKLEKVKKVGKSKVFLSNVEQSTLRTFKTNFLKFHQAIVIKLIFQGKLESGIAHLGILRTLRKHHFLTRVVFLKTIL